MVHALIMKALPDGLRAASPRSDAQALWHWDASRDVLVVQAARPLRGEILGRVLTQEPVVTPAAGDTVQVHVDLAALKTPPADVPVEIRAIIKEHGGAYRSRQVIVPELDRPDWAVRRLQRIGLTAQADALVVSGIAFADLGRRGGRIPFVSLRTTARVDDTDTVRRALLTGVGKGKNFGLGLLRIRSAAPSPTTSPLSKETPA